MKLLAFLLLLLFAGTGKAVTPPPSNDRFGHAQVLLLPNGTVTGTTAGAKKQPGEPPVEYGDGDSIWYTFTPLQDGVFTVQGSTIYSGGGEVRFSVYRGTTLAGLKHVGESTYSFGLYTETSVSQPVLGGRTYYLRFDTYSFEHLKTGSFSFSYRFETAGAFAFIDAPLPTYARHPWTYREGIDSSFSLTVGRLGGSAGAAEVNYQIAPDSRLGGALSGTLHFDPGVTRQTIPLTLANDSTVEGLVLLRAQLLQPTANATVLLRGAMDIAILDDDGNLPNDAFANAQIVTPAASLTPISVPWGNGGATTEPGEDTFQQNASIWYRFNPAQSGVLTLSTAQNLINVYTGDSLSTLQYVLSSAPYAPKSWTSPVTGGHSYVLEVNDAYYAPGAVNYTFDPAASLVSFEGYGGFAYDTATKPATVQLTVSRTGNLSSPATVHYATGGTSDAAADAGDESKNKAVPKLDFTPQEGTLTFGVGVATKTITVAVLRHRKGGVQKHINVVLDDASGTALGQATTRIYLNDGKVTNPFRSTAVTFTAGLSPAPGGRDGSVQVTTTSGGLVTASVRFPGAVYTGHGQFLPDYTPLTFPVHGPAGAPALAITITPASGLQGGGTSYVLQVLDGTSVVATATLAAGQLSSGNPPTGAQGLYTATLQPGNEAPAVLQAPGMLSLKISATARFRAVGRLPDGTPFSAGGIATAQGSFNNSNPETAPLVVPLYGGAGLLDGTITVTGAGVQTEPPPSGDGTVALRWVRPATGSTAAFATGVNGDVSQFHTLARRTHLRHDRLETYPSGKRVRRSVSVYAWSA